MPAVSEWKDVDETAMQRRPERWKQCPRDRSVGNIRVGQSTWKDGKGKLSTYRNLEFHLGNAVSNIHLQKIIPNL